jgi:hypothetical protein
VKFFLTITLTLTILLCQAQNSFNGNGMSGFGSGIGTSTLQITEKPTEVEFLITRGGGLVNDALVLYIDHTVGGFSNTTSFTDISSFFASAASAKNSTGSSTVNFSTDFNADIAIVVAPRRSSTAEVLRLQAGTSHTVLGSFGLIGTGATAASYKFAVPRTLLTTTLGNVSFKFLGTYVNAANPSGFLVSNEGFGGGLVANVLNGNVSFSSSFDYPLIVAPLFLRSFYGQTNDANIEINFVTSTESNLHSFVLQKSRNGVNWFDETTIAPRNNSTGASYTYIDNVPFFGNNFYRIIAKDNSNRLAYSAVIKLQHGKLDNNLIVFPNPVRNIIKVGFGNSPVGMYTASVINNGGQVVFRKQIKFDGNERFLTLEVPATLNIGPYRLFLTNGKEFYRGTFIME